MQPWARHGLRAALVTGGLLMLGTGIASADQHVDPNHPTTPDDNNSTADPADTTAGPGGQALGLATAPPGTEETDSITDTHMTAPDTMVSGFTDTEWAALSGDLADAPPAEPGLGWFDDTPARSATDSTVFRVPVDILGTAIDTSRTVPVSNDDTTPRLPVGAFGDHERFGPSEQVDRLLHANQVPGLLPVTGGPVGLLDLQHTQVMPVIRDTMPETQVFPAITDDMTPPMLPALVRNALPAAVPVARPAPPPRYQPVQPMAGQRPLGAHGPTNAPAPRLPMPSVRSGQPTEVMRALPDLPPVPTLPSMPALPHRGQASGRPSIQDIPAQQLMDQLRGLVQDLDTGGGRHMRPMFGDDL